MATPRVHHHPDLCYSRGTQVVVLQDITDSLGNVAHPKGSVGVVTGLSESDGSEYSVSFADGKEGLLPRGVVTMLARFQEDNQHPGQIAILRETLKRRVIFRCVIGSRAYGLDGETSDTDRRGVFLAPTRLLWSLQGCPQNLEDNDNEEFYWEIERFLVLALKANPNILECLHSPIIEQATPLGRELLDMKEAFLSKMAYQTFNGYILSQFQKMGASMRNRGAVKWKHVMHLLRLLMAGIRLIRDGYLPVRVEEHRDELMAVKRGEIPWEQTERWRLSLHAEFDRALKLSPLPDRPDYERANQFLLKARELALGESLP